MAKFACGPHPSLVMSAFGKARTVPPQLRITLPQSTWVQSTPPLALARLVRSREKPVPVPRLGQVLEMVRSLCSVRASRLEVLTPVLGAAVAVMVPWVVAMVLRALDLRVVQFPMALIRPGTRLPSCRSRVLTAR